MNPELEAQLMERLKNAHRIESSIQLLLADMAADAGEPLRTRRLESRGLEARHHKQRLQERLQCHGERAPEHSRSTRTANGSLLIARLIASYELLGAIARSAGDFETARVADLNRSEDQAFVGVLFADHFDLRQAAL